MTVEILGLPFQNVTMEQAVNDVYGFFSARESKMVVTPNTEILQMFDRLPEVRQAILQADYVVPDGAGVIKASRMLGAPLKEKVAGIELGLHLMKKCAGTGGSVYLLGAKPGVAEKAKERLLNEIPGLNVAGVHDGYFNESDEQAIVEEINRLNVDMLLVCLGAPKQELWMAKHKKDLRVGAMLGLGGSLDVIAGNVRRAPRWMIRYSLEWLYRIAREPKRIGRVAGLPFFLLRVKKGSKKRSG